MQRLHQDDLAGHLKEQGGWDCLDLPAIAEVDETIPLGHGATHQRRIGDILHPERESRAALEAIKMEIGSDAFFAQYQQMPVPPGGAMIKRAWIRRYAERPRKDAIIQVFQSWDTAMKSGPGNDYSVCTTWAQTHDCKLYLRDLWRGRVDYPTLKAQVLALYGAWRPSTILMEETGTAIGLIDALQYQCFGLVGVKRTETRSPAWRLRQPNSRLGTSCFRKVPPLARGSRS
jgi:hypothetical protein